MNWDFVVLSLICFCTASILFDLKNLNLSKHFQRLTGRIHCPPVIHFIWPEISQIYVVYASRSVNSKTTHPPGQSPGMWLALSSVQWGPWPKIRPTWWVICLSCQNVRISQFFDSARGPRSRVISLVDSMWVFLLLSFYIVISWNMSLFKVWSKDKLNKKFVVAENFAELVSQLL